MNEIQIIEAIREEATSDDGNLYTLETASTPNTQIPSEIKNSTLHGAASIHDDCIKFLKQIENRPKNVRLLEILHELFNTDLEKDEMVILKNFENVLLQKKPTSIEDQSNCNDTLEITNPLKSPSLTTAAAVVTSLPPPPPPQISPSLQGLLPQQSPPIPNSKMKIICWDKIPSQEIVGGKNLWTILANNHKDDDSMKNINWLETELLFSIQTTTCNSASLTLNRKSKNIKLLDCQRSFNVDILLEQFKGYKSDTEIVQLVDSVNHSAMGSEKIQRLIKLLPEPGEIDLLKHYEGNPETLDRSEKFFLKLIDVPSYKLRLECMSFKEDFTENVQILKTSISLLDQAGKDLLNNRRLHEVMYVIVLMGNFLNTGKYTGKAVGIRVASLLKLSSVKANANNMNFLHLIADQIKKSQPDLLNFPQGLKNLTKVNKINIEQLSVDVKRLSTRFQEITIEMDKPTTDMNLKENMISFLVEAESQCKNLNSGLEDVESMHKKICDFFCENSSKFSLSECFNIFLTFVENFTNVINELNAFELKSTTRLKQHFNNDQGKLLSYAKFDSIPEKTNVKTDFAKSNIFIENDVNYKTKMKKAKQDLSAKTLDQLCTSSIKSKCTLTPEASTVETPFARSNNFIDKEVDNLGKENQDIKHIRKFWANTQEPNKTSSKTLQQLNERNGILLEKQTPKQISTTQGKVVSQKIQKYLMNIEKANANNHQNNNEFQRASQDNPEPRTSSFRLKHQQTPSIPKFEKIGRRVTSITEQDLKRIIPKLRRTTSQSPSLMDMPQERLLGHCYQEEKILSGQTISEESAKKYRHSVSAGVMESTNSNHDLNKPAAENDSKESKSIFKRFSSKLRFFNKAKGL